MATRDILSGVSGIVDEKVSVADKHRPTAAGEEVSSYLGDRPSGREGRLVGPLLEYYVKLHYGVEMYVFVGTLRSTLD